MKVVKKNQEVISAVKWEPGMEDGYIMCTLLGPKYITKLEKMKDYPAMGMQFDPAIINGTIATRIEEGEYILTMSNGFKYLISEKAFKETYEVIKEELKPKELTITISGDIGSGKTVLSWVVYNFISKHSPHFVEVIDEPYEHYQGEYNRQIMKKEMDQFLGSKSFSSYNLKGRNVKIIVDNKE